MNLRYWANAAVALARHSRHSPGFFRELAASGLRAETLPRAPTVAFVDAYADAEGIAVEMGTIAFRRSNLDPMEQYVLAALARLRKPNRMFEIGTYDGATTLLLARNSPEAEVVTLDLPQEAAGAATVTSEFQNALHGPGQRFRGLPESAHITQLFGDSRTFDFSPWHGSMDLILVDGGHEYENVRADTANALKMLSPTGLIVWDDYQVGWPGVVRAVEEVAVPIIQLAGTDFAVYDPSCSPNASS